MPRFWCGFWSYSIKAWTLNSRRCGFTSRAYCYDYDFHNLFILRISFLLCKVEIMVVSTRRVIVGTEWENLFKALNMDSMHSKYSVDTNYYLLSRDRFTREWVSLAWSLHLLCKQGCSSVLLRMWHSHSVEDRSGGPPSVLPRCRGCSSGERVGPHGRVEKWKSYPAG